MKTDDGGNCTKCTQQQETLAKDEYKLVPTGKYMYVSHS